MKIYTLLLEILCLACILALAINNITTSLETFLLIIIAGVLAVTALKS